MTVTDNTQSLGELIRTERKRQNVTQVELASLAGVGVRFLRELEKGKEGCQIGLIFSVLSTLGMSVHIQTRAN